MTLGVGDSTERPDFHRTELRKGVDVEAGVVQPVRDLTRPVDLDELLQPRDDCLGVLRAEAEEIADAVLATPLSQDLFEDEVQGREMPPDRFRCHR
jgi:hypothetical protein